MHMKSRSIGKEKCVEINLMLSPKYEQAMNRQCSLAMIFPFKLLN